LLRASGSPCFQGASMAARSRPGQSRPNAAAGGANRQLTFSVSMILSANRFPPRIKSGGKPFADHALPLAGDRHEIGAFGGGAFGGGRRVQDFGRDLVARDL